MSLRSCWREATMPSPNGLGPSRAILYARVSTQEQAAKGYSLAQQLEALRSFAAREGYEVIEEVEDRGQSAASLERPGMDRVRDLVATGGVSMVLAKTGTGLRGSQRICTCYEKNSLITAVSCALLTTEVTTLRRANSQTAFSIR